jgi:hypothetical protein
MKSIAFVACVAVTLMAGMVHAQQSADAGKNTAGKAHEPLPKVITGQWERLAMRGGNHGGDITLNVDGERTGKSFSGTMTMKLEGCGVENGPFKGTRTDDGFVLKAELPNYNSAKPPCRIDVRFRKNDRGTWSGKIGDNNLTLHP